MIANYVETYLGGLCSVMSGAWDRISAPELPADVTLAALLVVEAGEVPLGEYSMHLAMLGPTGDRVGRSSFPVTVEATGRVLRFSKYVPLSVHLETIGVHQLVVSTDLCELLSVPVAVGNHSLVQRNRA
jgi:hypothetical protein